MTNETSPPAAVATPMIENSMLVYDWSTPALYLPTMAFHERTIRLPRAFIVQHQFEHIDDHASLVPDGFDIRMASDIGEVGSIVAVKDDSTTLVQWMGTGVHYVTISSTCPDEPERTLATLHARHPVTIEHDRCEMHTWRLTPSGSPQATTTTVDAPTWAEVSRNYSGITRSALDALTTLDHPPQGGPRLLLWHGEPGTGKTSAIRALARQWSKWCDLHIIAEPEALINKPEYLDAALSRQPQSTTARRTAPERQRLVVMEDCDVLLSRSRDDAGAALSRLLNSTDGLADHARRSFVLITTNSPVQDLHPALIRPGRCRAIVEFTSLSEAEANDWLPDHAEHVTSPRTLAELYVDAGIITQVTTKQQTSRQIGFA